jgi:hypothetical protein
MKIIITILALFGCIFLSIIAHEVRHLFQREYTQLCFSWNPPAFVENINEIEYRTHKQIIIDEILPYFWSTIVFAIGAHYVINWSFEK